MGGLGNQLFQINFAKWLEGECGADVIFNNYLLKANLITRSMKWSIHEFILPSLIDDDLRIIEERNLMAILSSKAPLFNKYSFFSGLDFIPKESVLNLFGYFQNANFLKQTYGSFGLKQELLPCQPREAVVMHLRGADMNNFRQGITYYEKVLTDFQSSQIYVVTNCNDTFFYLRRKFIKHEFVNISSSAREDFLTCCSASTLIVAPSTFSWWAARLGVARNLVLSKGTYDALGSPRPDGICSEIVI